MKMPIVLSSLRWMRLAAVLVVAGSLGGCNLFERLANVGEQPPLTPVIDPSKQPGYRPVTMPMPEPQRIERLANSLWRPGARSFFGDQRAARVGDILTIAINIDDSARVQNETRRARENDESLGVPGLLGYEALANRVLPDQFNPALAVGIDSESTSAGRGQIERQERIQLRVAAIVTQVLPNGNLVLFGRQETRINFEIREVVVAGVIRPEDVSSINEINYAQMAEARVAYGGRGQLSDLQQPRYGQQVLDIILPF